MALNENNKDTQTFTIEEINNYEQGGIYKGCCNTMPLISGPVYSPQLPAALHQGGG